MRAIEILQDRLGAALGFLHAKRRDALWRVVDGLLNGQELWLTELGRSLPGACSIKHRVKAVDRFLGNACMQAAIPKMYAALASFLLRANERPILLVDWSAASSGYWILSAKIAFAGRALSILSRSYPENKKANPHVEREFLLELKKIIPARSRPVLVTDAGFLFKWVDSVVSFGWDYLGRARLKKMALSFRGQTMPLGRAYNLATDKPRSLGIVSLGKANPRAHRVILSAKPTLKGRTRLGPKGKRVDNGTARSCRAGAREPLLLITSLADAPKIVVGIYRMRMQIEQTFRDLKSHRYGWSTRHIRTTHPHRIDLLLLIAAFAAIAMHIIGLSIRGTDLARGLQANTERKRTVFSTFFLGRLALRERLEPRLRSRALRAALGELLAKVRAVSQIAA